MTGDEADTRKAEIDGLTITGLGEGNDVSATLHASTDGAGNADPLAGQWEIKEGS